jgi:hypothetical protein
VKKRYVTAAFVASLLMAQNAAAVEFEASVGLHDFVVSDIKNDVVADGISAGTSHTFGLNAAIYVKHQTKNNINFLAKAEAFLDNDQDHLDPDHIPVWFDFLLDINGLIYTVNERNSFKWYVLMDNRQNTVSCIEREVRQHLGLGYEYNNGGFTFDFNAYAGFYYIEIDDDTPVARGYSRQDTDDGEASNVLELEAQYNFNKAWSLYANIKRYAANAGTEKLENNAELLLTYKGSEFLSDGATLNLKVKYVEYDLDRFYRADIGVPILPFDNNTLIQAYVTLPINF